MYHMVPYAHRPQANYSRARHGEFQNLVESYVNKLINETDVVGADNLYGRKLFNSMDTFFSYGLLTRDGAYWRFIRTFLPRAEQKMLMVECGNANDRFLSVGWLKTSFNKGTLHFMLLSLNNQSNKVYLGKFYHENSCIRNSGLLEAITDFIGRIQPVQFAFYSTRQLRAESVPAAVVQNNTVNISSRAAARQRKLTEKEASNDTVPNIIPTEIPNVITQTMDQDVLLDELVRNRHNRLNGDMYDSSMQQEEDTVDAPESFVEENLEDVMTKKMSCVNMESLDQDGIEKILASVEMEEEPIPEYTLADGEYLMSQGDILHCAINVFEKSSEKIIECFKVLENFHSDNMELRYFVMTNYNIYVFKYRIHTANPSADKNTNLTSDGFFIPLVRMPHDRIRTIKIGIDNLSFMVESNEQGFSHYLHNEEFDDQTVFSYFATMGGLESGAHMINSLINVVQHSSRQLSLNAEVDDHMGYMCMLQPNLEKQLGRSVDIRTAALGFWYEQSCDEQEETGALSGYLFKTSVHTWIKSSEPAEHKYCVIVGTNFHVFDDSTCKSEDTMINLSTSTVTAAGRVSFQLRGAHGAFEFECASAEEQVNWIKSLSTITENKITERYIAPCLAVITENSVALIQEGEKFWYDGFLRLLGELPSNKLKKAIVVTPPEDKESIFASRLSALCLVTDEQVIHYFFVRFEKELERVATSVHTTFEVESVKLDEEMIKTPLGKTIHNTCCSIENLWPN